MSTQDDLLSMFTARLEERDGSSVIQLPDREIDLGTLSPGNSYRVAILGRPAAAEGTTNQESSTTRPQRPPSSEPPVTEGEQLDVEIEDIGEQGDGIARVGPGYIIFVPDTDIGDRVTIEVTQTRENFGFGEVVTPEPITG